MVSLALASPVAAEISSRFLILSAKAKASAGFSAEALAAASVKALDSEELLLGARSMPAKMAIIAMITSNSMRVKPERLEVDVLGSRSKTNCITVNFGASPVDLE